ncbi:MAG TPA: glycerate kinase [Candidatus Avidesulfovibrio excrementigallinarum]|nr:glycerate kinase [Candidatus Avidesulfovibrio excrementigallinarum]
MSERNDIEGRRLLRRLFEAGLEAVAPDRALLRHVRLEGQTLLAGGRIYACGPDRRVLVVGGGKGVAPMARALESLLGRRLDAGVAVTRYGHGMPLERITLLEAAHPVPDEAGRRAAEAMLDLAQTAGEDDLVIALFTGGASALTPAPVEGVTLEDLRLLTRQLLCCGATIHELNALRKHLSRFSGGQLARATAPAEVLGILVSDVPGDDLDVIASGPTAPDASTFEDCLSIVDRYGLRASFPKAALRHLEAGASGQVPETPKQADPLFQKVHNLVVASNRQALEAVAAHARKMGFAPRFSARALAGEARVRAVELAHEARRLAGALQPGDRPICLLAGGETTVTVRGAGQGGRNQEMALAAALELERDPAYGRVCALFAGTDGIDGTTGAAGGFAFADSAAAMRRNGADPVALLDDNDSHTALAAADDLLITGPTKTNVMDLAIVLIQP